MAHFDVHRRRGRDQLLLDCQSDLLAHLPTRMVIPLLRLDGLPARIDRLHPVVAVAGERLLVATHLAASIPIDWLGARVTSLAHEHFVLMNAIDTLFSDY